MKLIYRAEPQIEKAQTNAPTSTRKSRTKRYVFKITFIWRNKDTYIITKSNKTETADYLFEIFDDFDIFILSNPQISIPVY